MRTERILKICFEQTAVDLDHREDLGLSRRNLAQQLGVAVETISRWENGPLTQTRAMDRYLRVYFGVPAVRAALVDQPVASRLGVHVET